VPPTSCTVNGKSCSSSSTGTGTGTGGTGTGGTGPGGSTGGSGATTNSGNFTFAPYVDATVDTPPFDLVKAMQASGTKNFTLGFVVSQGNTCEASWGSFYPVSTDYYASGIAALRHAGGDVIVSFGGQASTELADTCTTVAALQAQYQSVINTYRLTHIDFDIEGADEGNAASLARRAAAIAGLERANPTLSVSLTLPVLPTGLDYNGHNVLTTTINAGARVDLVNVMAMDYGGAAPNPSGHMGAYAIQAAKATEAQLATFHPSATSAQLWKMVGVTPMLGVNDTTNEIFGLTDAQQLETFASQVGMGRLSMWASTRDISCPGGAQGFASDTCSGITQQPFAFSTVFAAFNG
jgi:hypothetical protein